MDLVIYSKTYIYIERERQVFWLYYRSIGLLSYGFVTNGHSGPSVCVCVCVCVCACVCVSCMNLLCYTMLYTLVALSMLLVSLDHCPQTCSFPLTAETPVPQQVPHRSSSRGLRKAWTLRPLPELPSAVSFVLASVCQLGIGSGCGRSPHTE